MQIIEKHRIPLQKCKNCKSIIKLTYRDLKWDDGFLKHRKNTWKCPVCKERDNVIIDFDKEITQIRPV